MAPGGAPVPEGCAGRRALRSCRTRNGHGQAGTCARNSRRPGIGRKRLRRVPCDVLRTVWAWPGARHRALSAPGGASAAGWGVRPGLRNGTVRSAPIGRLRGVRGVRPGLGARGLRALYRRPLRPADAGVRTLPPPLLLGLGVRCPVLWRMAERSARLLRSVRLQCPGCALRRLGRAERVGPVHGVPRSGRAAAAGTNRCPGCASAGERGFSKPQPCRGAARGVRRPRVPVAGRICPGASAARGPARVCPG